MARSNQNLLGQRPGLSPPMPKAEALAEARTWLRNLTSDESGAELSAPDRATLRPLATPGGAPREPSPSSRVSGPRPYAHPYYWAAFVLVGDPIRAQGTALSSKPRTTR
jgi:CHAT domain-containing protein